MHDDETQAQLAKDLCYMITAAHDDQGYGDLEIDEYLGDLPSAKDTLNGLEAPFWHKAICEELNSIAKAEVYTLVNPAKHNIGNLLGSKLVL